MVTITKTVHFVLNNQKNDITLTELKKNYSRPDILKLFETLQGLGYGEFRMGSRGRGQCSRFIKNDSCPVEFDLVLTESPNRGRPRKVLDIPGIEAENTPIVGGNGLLPDSDSSKEQLQAALDSIDEADSEESENLEQMVSDLSIVSNIADATATSVAVGDDEQDSVDDDEDDADCLEA